MVILNKVLQVVLALSILVLVHEFGHFIFARIFKIRVEKFYLFFDAWFSLFKYKPKNSDTEYGIGWLPLGGYCKISGMIDESMDKEALKKEPQPWEFRARPAWQRFLVIFGGVFFNILLAIAIYSAILFTWGESYIKNSDVTTGVRVNELAYEMGFRNGDRIISLEGEPVERFQDLQIDLIRRQATYAKVLRGDDTVTVNIDPLYIPTVIQSREMLFDYGIPAVIGEIPDSSINAGAGLQVADKIVAVNGKESTMLIDVITRLSAENASDSVTLSIERAGSIFTVPLARSKEGKIEVVFNSNLSDYYNITNKAYSLASAVPGGIAKTAQTISNYWKELKLIFTPKTEAYKSVGSFIAIGSIFPASWNWQLFWNLTAFLSVMLAVLNILPIPALDGGHLLFTVYEMITGRKPSDKFLEYAQTAGMLLLLAIMILAFGNDIFRLFN